MILRDSSNLQNLVSSNNNSQVSSSSEGNREAKPINLLEIYQKFKDEKNENPLSLINAHASSRSTSVNSENAIKESIEASIQIPTGNSMPS